MKRFACVLLVLTVLLCGCDGTKKTKVNSEELNAFAESVNAQSKLSAEYMLEITFGEGVTLYYTLGNADWDRALQTAYAKFDQTYLGLSAKSENFFKDGKMVSVEGGEAITTERDSTELFSKFPYAKIPQCNESCGEILLSSSTVGTSYTFTRGDTAEISKIFVEDDIYQLVGVIKKPQPEKTQYGDTKCVYTVKDGALVSSRFEFDMKLFDTPAYVPGGNSIPESEYTIDVHINAKITYKSLGEGVSVKEYSE